MTIPKLNSVGSHAINFYWGTVKPFRDSTPWRTNKAGWVSWWTYGTVIPRVRAIEEGADVRGYYARSLPDGYEWTADFKYGIVHIDFATQKRTPKDSVYWYANVIENNGIEEI